MAYRRKLTLARVSLLGVLALVGTVGALRTRQAGELTCTLLRRELPRALGLEVGIGRCEVDPLTQAIQLGGISLFRPGEDTPLLVADEAEVQLGGIRPLVGGVSLDAIRLVRPRVFLDLSKPPSAPPEPGRTCALDTLESLDIGRLAIQGAEIRITLPDSRRIELTNLDVGWRVRRGAAEFTLAGARGVVEPGGGGQELTVSELRIDGALSPEEALLEISRAELGLDEISISASGKIEQLCDPVFGLDAQVFFPLKVLARAGLTREVPGGHIWSRMALTGSWKEPLATVEVAAHGTSFGPYRPGDFEARLTVTPAAVQIDSLQTTVGAGSVQLKGRVALEKGLPTRLEANVKDASFGAAMARAGVPGAWVDFGGTGKGAARGTLLPLNLAGEAAVEVEKFRLATRAWDRPKDASTMMLQFERGSIRGGFRVLADRVQFERVELSSGLSRARGDATLYVDPARGLELRGEGEADLSDFGHIAELPWAGRGKTTFRVVGPYTDPVIDAQVSLRDFTFWGFGLGVLQGRVLYEDNVLSFPAVSGQKGRTPFYGSGSLRFEKQLITKGEVTIPRGGRSEDVIDVLAGLTDTFTLFQGVLTGETEGHLEIGGPASDWGGSVDLKFSDTRYYDRRLGDGALALRFVDGERLVVDRAQLSGPAGATWAEGTWAFAGPLDFRFGGNALSLAELVGPQTAESLELSSTLELAGTWSGDVTTPLMAAELTSPDVLFAGRKLGAVRLGARMVGKDVQITGKPFADASIDLSLRAKSPFPYDASLALALAEIRPLLPDGAVSQGLSGKLEGVVRAEGNLRNPMGSRVQGTFDVLSLSRGDFHGRNDGPLLLSWNDGRLTLEPFLFRGPNTELSAAGWLSEQRLDVKMRGALDMRLLESFVPFFERSAGRVELTAAASGSRERPSLLGTAQIRNARLFLKDQPYWVRGVNGRIEFSQQRVLIEEIAGVFNDGRVRLRGDVQLEGFEPSQVNVGIELDEVRLRPTEDLPLTASGELMLNGGVSFRPAGKPRMLALTGGLEIKDVRYRRDVEIEEFLRDLGDARAAVTSSERPREWLSFDVGLRLDDVRVENNLARMRMAGALRLTGTNARPGLLGGLAVASGGEAFFRGNQFTFTQGTVEFNERTSFDPVFDLHAQTQAREFLVRLHAFGRASDPQLLLTAEPELTEGDILSLLTLGVTSRDRSNTANTGAGLAAEALFNVSGLDRQVQRFLPKNAVLRDLSLQISTLYNGATGAVEPTAQLESTFLTERLRLGMTQPISGRGTRAQAEYRFDDRLSAQAQWDNENTDYPAGNLGLELKLSWEVE